MPLTSGTSLASGCTDMRDAHMTATAETYGRCASAAVRVALLTLLTCLAACAYPSRAGPQYGGSSDAYERSTHQLARAPEHAAACIIEHARARGHAAEMVPLYGMESVAVTVKTGAVGDLLAVLSLTRSAAGSAAATTTWTGAVGKREDFVRALTQGC
jgi:hypothetical protein